MDTTVIEELSLIGETHPLEIDAWRSNYFLSHQESQEFLHLLNECEAELALLINRVPCDSFPPIGSNELSTKCAAIAGRIQRLQSSISLHKKLPEELLSSIFLCCTEDNPTVKIPLEVDMFSLHIPIDIRWSISQVCSRWRNVALCTRELWNDLEIRCKPGRWTPRITSIASELIGRGKDRLKLTIWSCYASSDGADYPVIDFLRRFAPYFRELVLFLPSNSSKRLFAMDPPPFELLEYLTVRFIPDLVHSLPFIDNLGIRTFTKAPKLRTVNFGGAGEGGRLYLYLHDIQWTRVTSITISQVWVPVFPALAMLRQCVDLVQCQLRIALDPHPDLSIDKLAPIVLKCLRSIHLSFKFSYDPEDWLLASLFLETLCVPYLEVFEFRVMNPLILQSSLKAFISLIIRSSCSLTKFTTWTAIPTTDIYEILSILSPTLREINFITSNTVITADILDLISQGVLLPNLEDFRACIESPSAFMNMVECRWSEIPGPVWKSIRTAIGRVVADNLSDDSHEHFSTLVHRFEEQGRRIELIHSLS